jgi:uncharacterized protein YdeI (BOF family)
MRKTFILTLVLCVFAAFAYAQTGTSGSTGTGTTTSSSTATTATPTGTTTTTTKTTKHKAAKCSYKGTVSVVGDKTFTVHPATGDDVVLKVNDKTKYYPKGKTWDDVKVDAKVWGVCHKDGADNWAVSVHFSAAKAAKTPAAKSGR